MIKIKDWVAVIPEEERHLAYVGEHETVTREFLLTEPGFGAYSFYMDMAFDLSTVTTREVCQQQTVENFTDETMSETHATLQERSTRESREVVEVAVDCDSPTDIAPLSKREEADGLHLVWQVLAQHTRYPGRLQATLRAVGPAGEVKKTAVMHLTVGTAVAAQPAVPVSESEFQQMERQFAETAESYLEEMKAAELITITRAGSATKSADEALQRAASAAAAAADAEEFAAAAQASAEAAAAEAQRVSEQAEMVRINTNRASNAAYNADLNEANAAVYAQMAHNNELATAVNAETAATEAAKAVAAADRAAAAMTAAEDAAPGIVCQSPLATHFVLADSAARPVWGMTIAGTEPPVTAPAVSLFGKNLQRINPGEKTDNGIAANFGGDGHIRITGVPVVGGGRTMYKSYIRPMVLRAGVPYTVSFAGTMTGVTRVVLSEDDGGSTLQYLIFPQTIVLQTDLVCFIGFNFSTGNAVEIDGFLQVEAGDRATAHTPYIPEQVVTLSDITLGPEDTVTVEQGSVVARIAGVETDISATEAGQALLALHTNAPYTTAFGNCPFRLSYVADTKAYIDGSAPVLRDDTTGKCYRLTVTEGALTLEEVAM